MMLIYSGKKALKMICRGNQRKEGINKQAKMKHRDLAQKTVGDDLEDSIDLPEFDKDTLGLGRSGPIGGADAEAVPELGDFNFEDIGQADGTEGEGITEGDGDRGTADGIIQIIRNKVNDGSMKSFNDLRPTNRRQAARYFSALLTANLRGYVVLEQEESFW
eukprot:gnl/Chilomastix_caulleri/4230.p1 GENE.gnl/Chilomastix_caulleri/4230~~gnl/Chilomastix_caulleri/4230.p1  ORF type:complete len:162 (+),score=40.40 gnl/Chilomastix_caulleri/4230:1-486(+)